MKTVIQYLTNLILLIILLLASSCSKEKTAFPDLNTRLNLTTKKILFQYDYSNLSWGPNGHGWFIDSSGFVRSYNSWVKLSNGVEHIDWTYTDSVGYISSSDLENNFKNADSLLLQIDKTKVEYGINEMLKISSDSTSKEDTTFNQTGIAAFYCYYWDNRRNMYKRQLLAQTGDIEKHCLNPNAILLTSWLIETGKKTNNFFWVTIINSSKY